MDARVEDVRRRILKASEAGRASSRYPAWTHPEYGPGSVANIVQFSDKNAEGVRSAVVVRAMHVIHGTPFVEFVEVGENGATEDRRVPRNDFEGEYFAVVGDADTVH